MATYGKRVADLAFQKARANVGEPTPLSERQVAKIKNACVKLYKGNAEKFSREMNSPIENGEALEVAYKTLSKNGVSKKQAYSLSKDERFHASMGDNFIKAVSLKRARAACERRPFDYQNMSAKDRKDIMKESVNATFESRRHAIEKSFPGLTQAIPKLPYLHEHDQGVEIIAHLDKLELEGKITGAQRMGFDALINGHKAYMDTLTAPLCTVAEVAAQIEALNAYRDMLSNVSDQLINSYDAGTNGAAASLFDSCMRSVDKIKNSHNQQVAGLENVRLNAADSQAAVHRHAAIAYETGRTMLSQVINSNLGRLTEAQRDKIIDALGVLDDLKAGQRKLAKQAADGNLARNLDDPVQFKAVENQVKEIVTNALAGTSASKMEYKEVYRAARIPILEREGFKPIEHPFTVKKNGEVSRYVHTLTPANKASVVGHRYAGTENARCSGNRGKSGGHVPNYWTSELRDENSEIRHRGVRHAIASAFRVGNSTARAAENRDMAREVLEGAVGLNKDFQARAIVNKGGQRNVPNRLIHISTALTSPDALRNLSELNAEGKFTSDQWAAFDCHTGPTLFDTDVPNEKIPVSVDRPIQFCWPVNTLATGVMGPLVWSYTDAHNRVAMDQLFGRTLPGVPPGGAVGEILNMLVVEFNDPATSDAKKSAILTCYSEILHHSDVSREIYHRESYKAADGDFYKMPRAIGLLTNAMDRAVNLIESQNICIGNSYGCKSNCDRGSNCDITHETAAVMQDFGTVWTRGNFNEEDREIFTKIAIGPETRIVTESNRAFPADKSTAEIEPYLLDGYRDKMDGGNGAARETWS
jgi:hypothetical protein